MTSFRAEEGGQDGSLTFDEACGQINGMKLGKDGNLTFAEACLEPDTLSFLAVLGACENDFQWCIALQLLADLEGRGLEGSVPIYSSVMTSLEKVGHWSSALSLLTRCDQQHLTTDLIIQNAALGACQLRNAWFAALLLTAELGHRSGCCLAYVLT
eukprot:s1969_g2.t1